jgi:hypothetical protein
MTFDDFWTMYTRFHFDIYDDKKWEKLLNHKNWLEDAKLTTKFQAQELYMALVNSGELKGKIDYIDKTCDLCRTGDVCRLRQCSVGGYPRITCASFEDKKEVK